MSLWMRCHSVYFILSLLIISGLCSKTLEATQLETRNRDPYLGAIVIMEETGQILFEDNSDVKGYPASVLKLMDLLIILEQIKAGKLSLQDKVIVTAEAARIGGSQVYLKEKEVFTVDELLYALMVQSANDAATALAIHVAGSTQAFVALMNERAKALGMQATEFHSVHGLPPGKNQKADTTTARDLTRLCREILKHPETLRYTSTRVCGLRDNAFIMRTHNYLLASFDGCDGLKTGFFNKAGFSIAATAKRGNTRLIAIVLGSTQRRTRDAKAAELLAQGFVKAPSQDLAALPNPWPEQDGALSVPCR